MLILRRLLTSCYVVLVAAVVVVVVDVGDSCRLAVVDRRVVCPSQRLGQVAVVSGSRTAETGRRRAGSSSIDGRQAPAASDHRRREEGRHARAARVPQDPPGRASGRARGPLLRPTLPQGTRLVQVRLRYIPPRVVQLLVTLVICDTINVLFSRNRVNRSD